MFRIGHGYDTHAFEAAKPLVLAGLPISHTHGLKAHSDGDVVIHAICDALLGACALGDMGQHFPDTDQAYANYNSRNFLQTVATLVKKEEYRISNLDVTILAQIPKLAPYIEKMRAQLALDLAVDVKAINIKATTTEEMGFVGRKEGIVCYAVVLLMSN